MTNFCQLHPKGYNLWYACKNNTLSGIKLMKKVDFIPERV